MKVLWLASSFRPDDDDANNVTGPLRNALMNAHGEEIHLTIVYRGAPGENGRIRKGSTFFRPVSFPMGKIGIGEKEWQQVKDELLQIIEEERADIIQCFGAEWPYSRIAAYTSVPVVVHMMGFLNIYHSSLRMVPGRNILLPVSYRTLIQQSKRFVRSILQGSPQDAFADPVEAANAFERETMRTNRYFMGRTEWDRNIVKYYSPNARYYHVPEVIKKTVYDSAGTWKGSRRKKLRLLTISSADDRKGNEIILHCARLLKDLIGLDFIWHVAGNREFFPSFERYTGISRQDVCVELIGMIRPQEIVRELSEADLFIHPSIIDNSPNTICEAQLIGCPVIASRVGGVPQLIEDGVTGFLYPYNEPHTLAFLIGNICRNEELLQRVSDEEVRVSLKRHDPQRIADTLISIYTNVIKESRNEASY